MSYIVIYTFCEYKMFIADNVVALVCSLHFLQHNTLYFVGRCLLYWGNVKVKFAL
jgi:hypothetical protein